MDQLRILVLDDDADLRLLIGEMLRQAGHEVDEAADGGTALAQVARHRYDAVLCDLMLRDDRVGPQAGESGLEVLEGIRALDPHCEVVMITGYPTIEAAVEAMRRGAFQFLQKPVHHEHLILTVERAARKGRDGRDKEMLAERLRRREGAEDLPPGLVAESAAVRAVFAEAHDLAAVTSPVFIHGETGTGKELVARYLHAQGPRRSGPWNALNCGALSESLVDAELFGHERGSFTGADRRRPGVIAASEGGTLFLDEVGDLPLAAQVRLLRFLEDGKVRPVGGDRERQHDVRVVAASHRDLAAAVAAGGFRRDLYHRLAVFELRLPPLRQRLEDLLPLVQHFLHRLDRQATIAVSPAAAALLRAQPWPGNVRELRNEVERAWLRSRRRGAQVLDAVDFRLDVGPVAAPGEGPGWGPISLAEAEMKHVQSVVDHCGGNRRQAAAILGLSERHLYRLLREIAG